MMHKLEAFSSELRRRGIKHVLVHAEADTVDENKELLRKWRKLVNMSAGELKKFLESDEGKEAGLSRDEAKEQGISRGRDSARAIIRMKSKRVSEWTAGDWKWCRKQVDFITRMSGNPGPLYDEHKNKTRKHTSLLIWGHNPKKRNTK